MLAQGRDGLDKTAYERHQPEQTLLYRLIEAHYPALVDQLAHQGKSLQWIIENDQVKLSTALIVLGSRTSH